MANVLCEAMTECAKFKPKYPNLNEQESALKFLAVYLKANNPSLIGNEYALKKYGNQLQHFVECCNLPSYLLEQQGK